MLSKVKKAALFGAVAFLFACPTILSSGCGRSGSSLDVYSIVEAPGFSPSAGTYSSAQTVTITSPTAGVTIYYTTDDSEPKETSTKYTGPITVSATVKIKAKAYLSPKVPSSVTSSLYEITGTVATPTFSPEAGTYASAQNVAVTCLTGGARITYTTDGSTPLESSTLYEDPLPISATTTLKAKAFLDNYASSEVASGIYYIGQESVPAFSEISGTFEGEVEKEITLTGSAGSTIYYTTDGSDPTVSSSSSPTPANITLELDSTHPTKTQTIKAFSAQSGKADSPITSETYTLSVTTEARVIDGGNVGKYASIGLYSNNPRMIYFDQTNGSIKYASYNGSAWSSGEVISGIGIDGGHTSLTVDSSGVAHVSYYSSANLYYANSSAWGAPVAVDTGGVGAFTSIALDPSGTPYISYYDSANKKVKYASYEASWLSETISDSALHNDNYGRSSIALDSSGKVYVLLHGNGEIISKTRAPLGNFTEEAITDYSSGGFYLDLALGSGSGSGINVFAVFCAPSLQYARSYDSGSSWGSPATISSSSNLQHISVAVDTRGGSDILHISAYDSSSQTLKYFTNSSGTWKEYCIDDNIKVGTYSSIAVDSSGYFHISYYDEANRRLKYATNKP